MSILTNHLFDLLATSATTTSKSISSLYNCLHLHELNIATTPLPPCPPTSVGSASILYSVNSTTATPYTCMAYEWISPTTGLVTLAFQLRHDPNFWFLDDVSVINGVTQMLSNEGFETGNLSPWVRTTPNGACGGAPTAVTSASSRSGSFSLRDSSNGCTDQISQAFNATSGRIYIVSFWLKSGASGSITTALVTLS